jgi:hypothetical protein
MTSLIITENFSKLTLAFHRAIARKEIIGIISPHGVGFKFTLKLFAEKHYLKIIYCNVRQAESVQQVLLSLVRHLCNVRFSSIDYSNVSLFNLHRAINSRFSTEESCLLCIDNCDFRPAQLRYFIRFLQDFKKPVGLVFRMRERYTDKMIKDRKFDGAYEELDKIVDGWGVLKPCGAEECQDIARSMGVSDTMLLEDLAKYSSGNLNILTKEIKRYKALANDQNTKTKI